LRGAARRREAPSNNILDDLNSHEFKFPSCACYASDFPFRLSGKTTHHECIAFVFDDASASDQLPEPGELRRLTFELTGPLRRVAKSPE
jgi:hypothetical protein